MSATDDQKKPPNPPADVMSEPPQDKVGESVEHDAVFGEIIEGGPNYRNVGWIGTVALMMKTQFGLGILGIPSVLNTLGLIPGIICVVAIGGITTWSNYMIGVFKLRHPDVYGVDDVGHKLFGPIGREVFGVCLCIYWVFAAASGLVSTSIGLNAVSTHATCTAVFIVVAAVVSFGLASIRTLAKITWIAWAGVLLVFTAVITVTAAVGVQDAPHDAPTDVPWVSDYKLVGSPTFAQAISAVSSIVFAFAGTPGFFPIVAEMRDPSKYTRSLLICQGSLVTVYVIVGTVVYYFCGSYVASPALGSAGPLIKKVAYGVALPGLVVSTIIVIHFPAKYVFVRVLRGTKHLTANTAVHWSSWFGLTAAVTLLSYIIASGIPVFSSLVSLIGALLGTLMSFQPYAGMWLFDNWTEGRQRPTAKWYLMVTWCVFVIVSGTFLMIGGTYGAVLGIIDSSKTSSGGPWSCADNSNSS